MHVRRRLRRRRARPQQMGAAADGRTAASGTVPSATATIPTTSPSPTARLKLTAASGKRARSSCASSLLGFVTQYTGAMVSTWKRFLAGLRSLRDPRQVSRGPPSEGCRGALWLWPQNARYGPWPAIRRNRHCRALQQTIPTESCPPQSTTSLRLLDPNATRTDCMVSDPGEFHHVPGRVDTIDHHDQVRRRGVQSWTIGSRCFPRKKPAPFDQPFFIALTQALGQGANAFDPSSTPLPATMEIDWVHVWK